MSIPNLHVWMDPDDRHVWAAHRCKDGLSVEMLPYPRWRKSGGANVTPSFHCTLCGTHEFGRLDHGWPHWLDEWRANNSNYLGDK